MCSKSELDLFSVPPTQVVMEKGFWEDVDPITSISSSDTIEFLCAANFGVYTDLASSYLYVKAKITTAAGGNVGADIQVGPSNLWMHTLFSQVEVFLNNKLVTPSSTAYPTSFPGLSYEDEARHEKALVWAGHVTTQKMAVFDSYSSRSGEISFNEIYKSSKQISKQPKDFSIDIIYV